MEEIKYSGNWKILDNEYYGDLYIVQSKGIIRLVLLYKGNLRRILSEICMPYRIKLINGNLFGGGKVSLLNCTVVNQSTDISRKIKTIVIDCEYCIDGLNFKSYEDVKFCQVDFRLSKTMAWSGLNGFKYENSSIKTPLKLKYSFRKRVKYKLENDFKLEISPVLDGFNFDNNIEKINLRQYVIFRFKNKKEKNFLEFIELEKIIEKLIELGIRDTIDVISINGYKRSIYSTHYDSKGKLHKIKYPIKVYFKGKVKEEYEEPDINNMLFRLSEIKEVAIENWFKKSKFLKPIIEQYIESLKYDTVSAERRFLYVMQSLESYHHKFICKNKKEFYDRVNNLYKEEIINSYILDKDQANADYILIKNRIIDLILQSQLLWRFNPIIRSIYFTNSIINTRHYYTHLDEIKKEKSLDELELEEAYHIISCLLENYFLYELDIDKMIIYKKIQERLSRIQQNFKLLKNIEIRKEDADKIYLETNIEKLARIICYNYGLDEFESIEFNEETEEHDIDFVLKANSKQYQVIIFNVKKSDTDCIETVNKMKKEKIKIKRSKGGENLYILDYFVTRYRFCVLEYKK